MRLFRLLGILALNCIAASRSLAAVSIADDTFVYSQNFDSLANTGTTSTWNNNSTITGWYLFDSANTAITTYRIGVGSDNTSGFYSFGSTGSGERALGGIGSNAFAGFIAFALINGHATDLIDSITFSFNGEQWRSANNGTQTMVLEYGFGTSFSSVASWTTPGGNFNWTSPVTGNSNDIGNTTGLVTGRGGLLNNLSWAPGATLWIRWIESNDSGNDHGLAIDNFAVTDVTFIPEPSKFLLCLVGLLGVALRRRRS